MCSRKIEKIVNYFIVIILLVISLSFLKNISLEIITYHKIQSYFKKPLINNKEEQYLGIVTIPKIKLKKGFYSFDSKNNNVNKNLQLLANSTFPDKESSVLVLAGHSGYGRNAYFKDLDLLSLSDYINIYYKNIKYTYQIEKIYETPKNGIINVDYQEDSYLVLTTCSEKNKNNQLVIVALLKSKSREY